MMDVLEPLLHGIEVAVEAGQPVHAGLPDLGLERRALPAQLPVCTRPEVGPGALSLAVPCGSIARSQASCSAHSTDGSKRASIPAWQSSRKVTSSPSKKKWFASWKRTQSSQY